MSYKYIKTFRNKLKNELIIAGGGCCLKCGYNKYYGALAFHHLDCKTKKFTISDMIKRLYKIEDIIIEVNKCIILCHNCHSELHAGFWNLSDIKLTKYNFDNLLKLKLYNITKNCLYCKQLFNLTHRKQKFCSTKCSSDFRFNIKDKPTEQELRDLIYKYPTTYIAKQYNVSDKSIEKWCKKYKINKPPRGYWTNRRIV